MNKTTAQPYLISGGIHTDERGTLKFVNAFDPGQFKRFYVIRQSPGHGARAWQGHKTETKGFCCMNGAFAVRLARIENWKGFPVQPEIISFTLRAETSEVLIIPGGYANGLMALEEGSRLLVFSEFSTGEARDDEIRFDRDLWINWDKL